MNLKELDDRALVVLWADAMRELRQRGLVRSANLVGDYGERLAAERLGLTLVGKGARGHDATADAGTRYQIKARRLTPENRSRRLGISNLDFDVLVIVLFDEQMNLLGMWKLDRATVTRYARPRDGAHVLVASPSVLADPAVEQVA